MTYKNTRTNNKYINNANIDNTIITRNNSIKRVFYSVEIILPLCL